MDDSKEVTLSKYRFEQSERCIRSAKLFVKEQVENAEKFCGIVKEYLLKRYNNE